MKQKIILLCTLLVSVHLFDVHLRAEQTISVNQSCVEITIKPATVKLDVGGTKRLGYVVAPETEVQISWATDNDKVATVSDDGVVTATGYGTANIICTDAFSGAKGTCVVIVEDVVENLTFTEACITANFVTDPITGREVRDIDSTVVKFYHETLCQQLGVDSLNAYVAGMRIWLCSNLYFNAEGQLDGADLGGLINGYAPCIYVPKELNPAADGHQGLVADVLLSMGEFSVDEETAPTAHHHMQVGKLNNDTMLYYYSRFFAHYTKTQQFTEEGYQYLAWGQGYSVFGTKLLLMAYDEVEGEYGSYPNIRWQNAPNAIITGGKFIVENQQGSSPYMYKLSYVNLKARKVLTDDFGIPGVFTDMSDPNNIRMISTGWELGNEFTYHSGTAPDQTAKRMVRGIPMVDLPQPIILPSVEEDRKIMETFERNFPAQPVNSSNAYVNNIHKISNTGYEITACAAGCGFCKNVFAEQGEQVTIYANAVDDGNFLFWNDGNTDNPRIITAQQDTTLIAYFGMRYQCGDSLTWSFDFNTGTLYINGTGRMYDYDWEESPWFDINGLITKVVLNDGITHIGDNAFTGCSALTTFTIPTSVTSIGNGSFVDCSRLADIYCYATTPPSCPNAYTFEGVSEHCYLHVPVGTKRTYELAVGWSHFIHILEMSVISGETTDEVNVEVTANTAIFTWPVNPTASSYTLVIKKNDEVFCTLTFNSLGQLVGMAFAPARNRNQQSSAESTVYGYSFVVSNLDASSTYNYTFTAKDKTDQVLSTKSGRFTTKEGTDLPVVPYDEKAGISKFIRDGQLYIWRDGVLYDACGTKVE